MSKIYLENLKQDVASVESGIQDSEPYLLDEYGEPVELADELRNNWDLAYSEILDLIELLTSFKGEIE